MQKLGDLVMSNFLVSSPTSQPNGFYCKKQRRKLILFFFSKYNVYFTKNNVTNTSVNKFSCKKTLY